MATEVSIKIRVDDANVADTMNRIEQSLTGAGVQGEASFRKIGNAADQANGHVTTSLDGVRLLSQEFGLRLPRALESMLSRIPAVTAGINSMVGALAGVAFAEVFYRGAEAIYNAEQKYISITAAAEKYAETLKKISEQDFTNTKDLATTQQRLDQATTRMAQAPKTAKSMQNAGLLNLFNPNTAGAGLSLLFAAHDESEDGAKGAAQMVELTARQTEQLHQQALAQIELNHALDDEHSKRQQILDAQQKQKEIAAENRSYDHKVQLNYGNASPLSAGSQEEQTKNEIAARQAAAKTVELNNEVNLQIMKARDEAAQAGMQGEALYHQKQVDGVRELIAELNAQHLAEEIPERVKALNAKYDADRLERLRQLTAETQKQADAMAATGLTGSAKILAEGKSRTDDINAAQAKYTGGADISPEAQAQFDKQRAAAAAATERQLEDLEKQFTDRANELAQQRTESALGAFGKIEAAAQHAKDALQKTYDDDFSALSATDAKKIAATKALNDALAAIDATAAQQKKEQQQRNAAEDAQYDREAQAAVSKVRQDGMGGWVSQHQQAVQAIQLQEQQRLLKLQEDAQKEGLTDKEAAQRRVDIEAQANAEIAQQQQELQHQVAGALQSAFDDPLKYIKQQGEKMMFEMVASWLLQLNLFKNMAGGTLGGLHLGGGASGGAAGGGLFGGLLNTAVMHGGSTANAPSSPGVMPGGIGGGGGTYGGGGGFGGGSGSYSGTVATPSATHPDNGSAASTMGVVSSGVSDASSLAKMFGVSSTSSAHDFFNPNRNSAGGDGDYSSSSDPAHGGDDGSTLGGASSAAGEINTALGVASAGMAAYAGTEGVLDSFHQTGAKGIFDGTMSGAGAGAAIGSFFGPEGTAIGAAGGAVIGLGVSAVGAFMDEGNKFGARDYYKSTLEPELEDIRKNWANGAGGGDYLTAVSEANKDAGSGMDSMTAKYGKEAADWVNANYLAKELTSVTAQIERMARSGSAYTGRQASQFHTGGVISDFGDLGTSSNEGYIHAMMGEGIVNTPAMQTHGAAVGMMNGGADAAEMAAHYLSVSGARVGGSSTTNNHTHHYSAIDAKSFGKWLDQGGMSEISKAANRRVALYGGDAIA